MQYQRCIPIPVASLPNKIRKGFDVRQVVESADFRSTQPCTVDARGSAAIQPHRSGDLNEPVQSMWKSILQYSSCLPTLRMSIRQRKFAPGASKSRSSSPKGWIRTSLTTVAWIFVQEVFMLGDWCSQSRTMLQVLRARSVRQALPQMPTISTSPVPRLQPPRTRTVQVTNRRAVERATENALTM